MKYTKIFRALTLAVTLSLLLIAVPASPALAAESVDVSPSTGEIGDRVTITGAGFTPNDAVAIYFSSQDWEVGDEIDDDVTVYRRLRSSKTVSSTGTFTYSCDVPSDLNKGEDAPEDVVTGYYYLYVTYYDDDRIEAVEDFIVRGILLDKDEGPVGTEVEISGIGFTSNKDIRYIKYDGEELDIESGDDETDRHGEFECKILIPESTANEHTILVKDRSGKEGTASFIVEPEITISPTSGVVSDTAEVTGTGFGDEVKVSITFNGEEVATNPSSIETNEHGSFTACFDAPDVAAAIYDVEAEDEDGNKDEAEFTISTSTTTPSIPTTIPTSISISPITSQASPAYVGMDITISGAGFEASHLITITDETSELMLASTTSDTDGAFSATFKVPKSEPGEHIITASDSANTLACTFIMESIPPPIPPLLLPETGVKAESPVRFDWEAVTDDSPPVTYTLQIATDEDFTPASIVLEKEGLTDSRYAITEQEKLKATKKEAPYYWRVKAIDDISNESQWSDSESFYTISGFSRPDWMIHLWWGLGIIGAIFFGLWLGKRRTYYY